MSIKYRKYRHGDKKKILTLYREVFDISLNPDYWEWKYLKNPTGNIYIYLAFDNERCVGQYAMLPMFLSHYGEETTSLVALDSMVHPDYQRRGILTSLEKLADSDCPKNIPYYTFLNENSYDLYLKKFGWKYMKELGVYIKPVGLYSLTERNFLWQILRPFLWFYLKFYSEPQNQVELEVFSTFDSEIESIWKRENLKLGYTFNRGKEILKWRFEQNPMEYMKYKIKKNGRCLGYIVHSIQEKFGFRICWILDIFTDQNESGEQNINALSSLEKEMKNKCDFIALILPNQDYLRMINKAGYRKIPKKLLPHQFYFCVKKNKYSHTEFLDSHKWYFTWSLHDAL